MGFVEELSDCTCVKVHFDEPMKKHTGYGVGGCARYYVEADSLYSINILIGLASQYGIKYKVFGNGTNLLVSDKGYDGLMISTKKLSDVFFKREQVRAMSGASINKLIKFTLDHRLTGLEALSGLPATVGGAVVMNAGCFGRNISDYITEVETLFDGKIKRYSKDECKFAYRSSRFLGKKEIITSATFSFEEAEREIIAAGIKTYSDLRNSMQPSGKSCGSVFKNPKPNSAGALIEKAGLKGVSIGGATVSIKHGNFIIATQKATANDVYSLILHIKNKVKSTFNIELKEEVECVGEF